MMTYGPKQIGHVNPQRLKSLQTRGIVTGCPTSKLLICRKCVKHASLGSSQGMHFQKKGV